MAIDISSTCRGSSNLLLDPKAEMKTGKMLLKRKTHTKGPLVLSLVENICCHPVYHIIFNTQMKIKYVTNNRIQTFPKRIVHQYSKTYQCIRSLYKRLLSIVHHQASYRFWISSAHLNVCGTATLKPTPTTFDWQSLSHLLVKWCPILVAFE